MGKFNVGKAFKDLKGAVARHSPEILTGIGIAGMVTTTVLAVKATPKALQLLEDAKYEKDDNLTVPETVQACWKCYIPATITGVVSIGCLIGASSVSLKRNAALAAAYKFSETALTEYKSKVIETIGEKKEKTIREKIDKDHVDQNPVGKNEVIITGKGTTRCLDYHSGRYFESDIDAIKRAVNELNRQMLVNEYVSLNDFYDELQLSHTELGDELGWRMDGKLIDIDFSSQICDDGQPCIVLNYTIAPTRDYYKFA